MAEPIIMDSARKHNITDADILHAYSNVIHVVQKINLASYDDPTRDQGYRMIIGPAIDGRMLEIGSRPTKHGKRGTVLIWHAMPARRRYLAEAAAVTTDTTRTA